MRILNLLSDCKRWVQYKIRRTLEAIGRIFGWMPLLWNDREWDHGFLLEIIAFKLKRMRKEFKNCKIHSSHGEDIKEITKALKLMELVRDDSPIYDKLMKPYTKKWGKTVWKETARNEHSVTGYYTNTKVKTKKQQEQCSKEFRKLINKSHELQLKASKEFWLHMDKHYRGWWC